MQKHKVNRILVEIFHVDGEDCSLFWEILYMKVVYHSVSEPPIPRFGDLWNRFNAGLIRLVGQIKVTYGRYNGNSITFYTNILFTNIIWHTRKSTLERGGARGWLIKDRVRINLLDQ
jgi:hypothetical protein